MNTAADTLRTAAAHARIVPANELTRQERETCTAGGVVYASTWHDANGVEHAGGWRVFEFGTPGSRWYARTVVSMGDAEAQLDIAAKLAA